jgi:hypothetical protein
VANAIWQLVPENGVTFMQDTLQAGTVLATFKSGGIKMEVLEILRRVIGNAQRL